MIAGRLARRPKACTSFGLSATRAAYFTACLVKLKVSSNCPLNNHNLSFQEAYPNAFGPEFNADRLEAHGRSLATDGRIDAYRMLWENISGERLECTDVCKLYQDCARRGL